MKLSAWHVYPGESPDDFGSLLVFARNRYFAQKSGFKGWPGTDIANYTEMRATRLPDWDKYGEKLSSECAFDCNEDLPENFPKFWVETQEEIDDEDA